MPYPVHGGGFLNGRNVSVDFICGDVHKRLKTQFLAGVQDSIRPADIGLQGGDFIVHGFGNQRLRGEVKDYIRLERLQEGSQGDGRVLQIAVDSFGRQRTLTRVDEESQLSTQTVKSLCQMRSQESRSPCDEDSLACPVTN